MASQATSDVKKRGCVFILGNKIDDSGNHRQYGQMMKTLWEDKIGCELFRESPYYDVTGKGMVKLFKQLARAEDAANYEYLVAVIIARGGLAESGHDKTYQEFISGSDDKWLPEEDILSLFHNYNKCWQGKPKLWILCYSRFGDVTIAPKKMLHIDEVKVKDREDQGSRYPIISDFVLAYGSTTALIDNIYQVFNKKWETHSVLSMLTEVNNEMWRNPSGTRISRKSAFESSVSENFTLYPGNQHNTIEQGNVLNNPFLKDISGITRREFFGKIGEEQRAKEVLDSVIAWMKSYSPDNTVVDMVRALESQKVPPGIMREPLKGHVLLLSNSLDKDSKSHIVEKEMMESLWKKTLGCHVESHLEKTATEMKGHLKAFLDADASLYDYMVIYVSSHAGLRVSECDRRDHEPKPVRRVCPVGKLGGLVEEHEIFSMVAENAAWRDKVKIFILDYCRGEIIDRGVSKAMSIQEEVAFPIKNEILPPNITRMIDNSFIVYATHAGYAAYSEYFTPVVKNVFEKYWSSKSVVEMLTLVNEEMREMDKKIKAMSVFKSTVKENFRLYRVEI